MVVDDVSYRGLRRRLVATLAALVGLPVAFVYAAAFATNAVGLDVLGALLGQRFSGRVAVEPWAAVALGAGALVAGTVAVQAWLRFAVAGSPSTRQPRHLETRVRALADVVGTEAPAVRATAASLPAAFTVSLRPGRRTLVVTDGLRRSLSDAELDAVLLHELAHVRNRDAAAAAVAAGVLALAAPLVVPLLAVRGVHAGMREEATGLGNPTGAAVVVLGVVALAPAVPYYAVRALLARGVWHYREYVADSAAATLAPDRDALASALETVRDAREPATRALGLVDGFLFVPRDDGGGDDVGRFPLWPPRLQPRTAARVERVRDATDADPPSAD